MVHGAAWSIDDFYEYGWVKELQDSYQLILIDPRGHGYSDKPHEVEAYDQKLVVQDVLTVMDVMNVSKACYLGVSLAGHAGYGLAKYAPERLRALLIGAADPYPFAITDKAEIDLLLAQLSLGMRAYYELDIPESPNLTVTDWFMCRRLANDHEALIASIKATGQVSYEDMLPHNTIPCLHFVGTEDSGYATIKRCAEEMANAQLLEIPNRAHGDLFRFTDPLPGIKKFLAEVHR
jgi:pimeloyl-ACP methyl ester carboxylesterase